LPTGNPSTIEASQPASGSGRLRIALVVHEYNRHHGHSRYVAELASRYKEQHDVHIFATSFEEPEPERLTFHHVPSWRANVVTTLPTFFAAATCKIRGDFDIVHAQGFCGRRQNVVTAHICNAAWFAAVDKYQVPQSWRKRVFRKLVTQAERFVYRPQAAGRFIAVSERVRRDLKQYHALDEQVRVVYHGTDCERFHPRNREAWRAPLRAELRLAESDIAALYVGDWQKAGRALTAALALVPGVKLIVASRTSESTMRGEARAAGVEDRLSFLPPTDEIHRYYAAADLFLFPTFYDTFGLVVTEAMASGLPVITNREAGAAELIVDRESGRLTNEAWGVDEIAAALRSLAADAELRSRMGAAGRDVVERHTWDRTAAETMRVYEEVVGAKRGLRHD